MSRSILITDKGTDNQMEVEIWEGYLLLTPDTEFTMLLEVDEVKRLVAHLNTYLEEDEDA